MNKVPFCGCCAMNVILDISIGKRDPEEIQRRCRGDTWSGSWQELNQCVIVHSKSWTFAHLRPLTTALPSSLCT
ncbi:uncharacterized protein YALI1_C07516g [Yarrowia lipolytica]|uniref:Uncharacterized protein n=1 Tax=Yarrowia lipolytica TaxID=4952 RepID=A0A1D8N9T8_YARLL|nr:hypothetical protein YALI1_C07516g [Yarrowia lipolytica]